MTNPAHQNVVPSVSITTAHTGASRRTNALGMRPMQERAWARRGEQYLLIKSPPASGKSRALMFIALDKLHNQGISQAIIVVPERSIGASFGDEPLSDFGFPYDWRVSPRWNLCNAPGADEQRVASPKSRPSASSWPAKTEYWSVPTRPSASPRTSWVWTPSMAVWLPSMNSITSAPTRTIGWVASWQSSWHGIRPTSWR